MPHAFPPSSHDKPPEFAALRRELERCGWERMPPGRLEEGLLFQTSQGGARPGCSLYRGTHGEAALLAIDFGETALAGRSELFPRFLDFPLEIRQAIGAARVLTSAQHLLVASAGRVELYRLPDESLEYSVASRRGIEDELLPALAAKARSKGDGHRQPPPAMEGAESLRGWLGHWTRQLGGALSVPGEDCEKFIWKLILMLQARRKTAKTEILGGWGLALENLGSSWSLSYDALGTADDFSQLIEEFDRTFSTRIFTGDAEMHLQWLAQLEETTLAERLRAELLMQSQSKFEAESVAWLHTNVESEQEGWRREVAGLGPIRKRFDHDIWRVTRPLECDVARHGLGSALREADLLAQYWADYAAFARQESVEDEQILSQPDLFLGFPRGLNRRNELADPVNFILNESMRLRGIPAEGLFGVGLALLLKGLGWVQRHDWPFNGIDSLDRVFLI